MVQRIASASLLCALLGLLAWYLYQPVSDAAAIALGMGGERWYDLSLEDRHLGYWHTRTHRDARGNWIFESEQRFALTALDPVAATTIRTFSADPPHRLTLAEHIQTRRKHINGVRIEAGPDGYQTSRLPESRTGYRPDQPLNWDYTLADYLAFELWLAAAERPAGSSHTVTSLDFERLGPVHRSFDVIERLEQGYLIENAAPLSATRIRLDEHFVPAAVEIAGLFSLRLTNRHDALAPRSALQSASYYIPADRPLTDHTRISRLVLGLEGPDSPLGLFGAEQDRHGRWTVTLKANPVSSVPLADTDRNESLSIPSRHPEVARLAAQAIGDLTDDLDKAIALTRFVHGYLSYQPGVPPRSVLALLEDRRGDCTEFADLLTTLGRNVGLPSRTVFGLAYADSGAPAFAYHAWNELFVDGRWRAMDPTWGQDRVDATHIPLPVEEDAALGLLTGTLELAFSVLEVEHFKD
jgi:hypothetical protein